MPLKEGSSHEIISANIAELIKSGHEPEQAEAIAYKEAGRGKAEDAEFKEFALAFDRAPDNIQRIEANVYDALKKSRVGIAFDYSSVRSKSADGHLHVASTPISKAAVNDYLGREINEVMKEEPGWKMLEPDKLYPLLRDPEELKKAAHTFNNLPILSQHMAVTADSYPKELVVGSTGTDASFEEPYLNNSMALWSGPDINKVENNKKRELSSSYRYKADMTPGVYQGTPYAGRMTQIIGNHVALVKEGRAGSDVHVGDAALPTIKNLFVREPELHDLFAQPTEN
jgi:hypothetical protein